ncbi:MAG TPA: PhoH family protein [Salinivirga sp.]|uniref:PhoH family protein n=1 Tax=Salinivirga sp. TaxID=1970192 RepID=UPI002B475D24|nr:PhoH family protein [Salinivirga sp.]HKK60198.1 PhoH family protein [Salinivirga sp.]
MIEKSIKITELELIDLYGVNDAKLDVMRELFPKLRIVARGDVMKVMGEEDEILYFEEKLNEFVEHFHQYGKLTADDISRIVNEYKPANKEDLKKSDVLVFGRNGKPINARTKNQRKLVQSVHSNDLVFAIGPAGSGKTYTAIAMAVRALKNKEVKRIILSRPAVEAGENLGFLPGDLKEKIDPYLQPLYDALNDMLPSRKLESYLEDGTVHIAPLAFMRGRTLDNAFVILDEAQNTTINQLKMFLTRMGEHSKMLITGDVTQIDLPGRMESGLLHGIKLLKNIDGVSTVYLDETDIVRHRLVKQIVLAYQSDRDKRAMDAKKDAVKKPENSNTEKSNKQ